MRVIRFRHSCVRLEFDNGTVLVIDPGTWSEAHALYGADAVLVTHEHNDHIDVLRLAGLGAPVYAPVNANIAGCAITGVHADQEFRAAGIPVRAVGGRHAVGYAGLSGCANLGYVVEDSLYHPGDALADPAQSVDTLLIPMQGSWLKTSEAIDFARKVAPERAFGIHDGQLNERGLASINGLLARETRTDYRWIAPGEAG